MPIRVKQTTREESAMQCEGRVWGVGSLLDRDSHSLFCLSVIVALRVLGLSKGYRSPFGKVDLRNATDCVKQGVQQFRSSGLVRREKLPLEVISRNILSKFVPSVCHFAPCIAMAT